MKILFPYLARVRAANWSRYQQLLAALAHAGHEVRILEPPARPSAETNYSETAISIPAEWTVEEVPLPRAFWRTALPFDKIVKKGVYSIAANRRASEIAAAWPADVVLVYNLTQGPLLALPAPAILDVADDLPAMLREETGAAGFLLEGVARRRLARMASRAAAVTTPCRTLLPRLPAAARFVANGVEPGEIAAARRMADARPPAPRPAVGFLGSFEYFIDFDLVLGLAGRMPECDFVLIGGGRRFEEINRRSRSLANVALTGPLPHGEALVRLAGCDAALCPFTRDEVGHAASPLKLFEALALALPVVATRTRELLEERPPNTSYADTAEEAAGLLRRLLALPSEARRERAETAAAEVVRARSWAQIAREWVEIAREAAARRRG